jgi:hypothetical protein
MQKQSITHLPVTSLIRLTTPLEHLPLLRRTLVLFEFADTEKNRALFVSYATGELWQPVKSSAFRAWLDRKAKAVRPC